MKANKYLLLILALLIVAVMLTACGRKTIVVNDYLSVKFSGTDHMGTAESSLDWEQLVKDNMDVFGLNSFEDPGFQAVIQRLDEALRGNLDLQDNLSNGDQITYHWSDDDLDVLEEYNANFVMEDKSFTVNGLEPSN